MTWMALLRPVGGELEVAVALDDDEAVALHAGDGLRDRGAGVAEALGDAGAQRNDVLLLEIEDGAQVHLGGVDEIRHARLPVASHYRGSAYRRAGHTPSRTRRAPPRIDACPS